MQNTDNQADEFASRFTHLVREELRHNANSFAKSIGHDRNVVIDNTINGRSLPNLKLFFEIYAHHAEVNFDYLVTGRGKCLLSPGDEVEYDYHEHQSAASTNGQVNHNDWREHYEQCQELLQLKREIIEGLKDKIKRLTLEIEELKKS